MWSQLLKEMLTDQYVLDNISVVDKEVFITGMKKFEQYLNTEKFGEAFAWFYNLEQPVDKSVIVPVILRYLSIATERAEIKKKVDELENEAKDNELNQQIDQLKIAEPKQVEVEMSFDEMWDLVYDHYRLEKKKWATFSQMVFTIANVLKKIAYNMGDNFNKRYEGFNKYFAELKTFQEKIRRSSVNSWLSLSYKQRKNMSFSEYMKKRVDDETRKFDAKYLNSVEYRELITKLAKAFKEEDKNNIINGFLCEVDVKTLEKILSELDLLICMTDKKKSCVEFI